MDTKKIISDLKVASQANLATHKSLLNTYSNSVRDTREAFRELTEDRTLNRKLHTVGVNLNTFIAQVAMANLTTANALVKIIELLEKKEKKK